MTVAGSVRAVLIGYLGVAAFLAIDVSEGSGNVRPRRYLSFGNVSHFFIRLNFKANMVPWNQIFAQALGFRLNFDEPPSSFHPYHHIHRREVYDRVQMLLDKNDLNGFDCIRRAICEVEAMQAPRGIYYKILKIIFKRNAGGRWGGAEEECAASVASCPFSFLDVSLYTDQ